MVVKQCKKVFETFTNHGIKEYKKLSIAEYGNLDSVTDTIHLKWKHLNGPLGPSEGIYLRCDGSLVGRAMLQPRTATYKGKKISIAFVTDMLLHPGYRRPLNNFLSLIKSIKEFKQFDLVFHTSNEKTDKLYRELLHFKCPIILRGYGCPINLRNIIKTIFSTDSFLLEIMNVLYGKLLSASCFLVNQFVDIKIKEGLPGKDSYKELYERNLDFEALELERQWNFVDWRYISPPLWKTSILNIYCHGNSCGYIVLRKVDLKGIRFAVIMDFMIDKKITPIKLFFIRLALLRIAFLKKVDVLFTILNPESKVGRKMSGFPFFKIPDRYLPHQTPIFIHVNNPALKIIEEDKKINITLGDLDYF